MMPVLAPQTAPANALGQSANGLAPAVPPGEGASSGAFVDLLLLLIATAAVPCAEASSPQIGDAPEATESLEAAEAMPPPEGVPAPAPPPEYDNNLVALQFLLAAMAAPPARPAVAMPPAGMVSCTGGVAEGVEWATTDRETVRTTVADRSETPPRPVPETQAAGQPGFEGESRSEAAQPEGKRLPAMPGSPALQPAAPDDAIRAEPRQWTKDDPRAGAAAKPSGAKEAADTIRSTDLREGLPRPPDTAAVSATIRRDATPSEDPVVTVPQGSASTDSGGETSRNAAPPINRVEVRRADVLAPTMERPDGGSSGRMAEGHAGTPLPAIERQETPRDPARDQEESRQPPTTARREAPNVADRVDDAAAVRSVAAPRMVARLDAAADALPEANVERVVSAARASLARGGMEVHLRLYPESLGEVRVQVRWEGGTLSARLEAATPAARDALESGAPALRAALQEHGIPLDRLSVNMRMDSDARSQHRHLAPENPTVEGPPVERVNRTEPIPIPEPPASTRVDIRI
jgi:hypothetical protein